MEQVKQLEGFFVIFDPAKMEFVRSELERRGYAADSDGLSEFIIDIMKHRKKEVGSEADNVIDRVRKYVVDNPDKVQAGLRTASALMKMIKKR
jgi:hypothetical protein